ncbi:MAG: hypothetical protein HZB98_03940, partial [Bacteroidia bacterium]|nr:hypothetical protein [Bacteroidia bacterium]
MKRISILISSLLILISFNGLSQVPQQDIKDSKDHPLITRMPDFWISEYKVDEFCN